MDEKTRIQILNLLEEAGGEVTFEWAVTMDAGAGR